MLFIKKASFALKQAVKALEGEQNCSCAVCVASALDGVGGQRHAPIICQRNHRSSNNVFSGQHNNS